MLNFIKRLFGVNEEEHDPMKYLIVGIGNMGAQYDGTRHNIGFDAVDMLAKDFDVAFKNDTLEMSQSSGLVAGPLSCSSRRLM